MVEWSDRCIKPLARRKHFRIICRDVSSLDRPMAARGASHGLWKEVQKLRPYVSHTGLIWLPCAAPATIDLAVRRLVSPIKIESTIHKDSDYHCLQLIKQKAENQKWKELSFSIVGRPSPLSQQQSDHG